MNAANPKSNGKAVRFGLVGIMALAGSLASVCNAAEHPDHQPDTRIVVSKAAINSSMQITGNNHDSSVPAKTPVIQLGGKQGHSLEDLLRAKVSDSIHKHFASS